MDLISTPPKHQRSSSSIYYAAAWGSPYSTPSPEKSAEQRKRFSKVASTHRTPGRHRSERGNWLSDDSAEIDRSRRPAWNTERSDESWLDSHSDQEDLALTPTPKISAVAHTSPGHNKDDLPSFRRRHKGNDSDDTVKQADNCRVATTGNWQPPSIKAAMFEHEPRNSMNGHGPVLRRSSEEPPQQNTAAVTNSPSRSDPADSSPRSKRRPSATSAHSSQKSKKRVVWKGKACAISFPLDDARGQRPLLAPAEVVARIERWQSEGWITRGFQISSSPTNEESASQSCQQYPDPVDVIHERESGDFHVRVPNQAEWDIYVNFLKQSNQPENCRWGWERQGRRNGYLTR